NISEVHYATDNLELFLPLGYSRKDLEVQLHD
ncbi:TPA: zeta toxin family protein, partial [Enterococcus faecium]